MFVFMKLFSYSVQLYCQVDNTRPTNEPEGWRTLAGNTWIVFDIDGTREAARQRVLPTSETTCLQHSAD